MIGRRQNQVAGEAGLLNLTAGGVREHGLERQEEMRSVLKCFGISDATITRQPSFSSCAYAIRSHDRHYYGKVFSLADELRVRLAIDISDILTSGGIRTCHYNAAISGERYVKKGNYLYTVCDAISGTLLREHIDRIDSRRIGRFLAKVHDVLNDPYVQIIPLKSSMWNYDDVSARLLAARKKLAGLEESTERCVMLSGIQHLLSRPAAFSSLETIDANVGLIHGDFWPGNLIATNKDLDNFAIIDLESCARAPFLIDVVQFIDLAYSDRTHGKKTLQLVTASEFAREYVTARGLSVTALQSVPDLTLAARACSILWIIETHLERGPSALDGLIVNDLEAIEHVAEWKDAWLLGTRYP